MNSADVIRVLAANGNKVTPEQRSRIEHLIANTSQAELAGVISTLRQGHTLPQAEEWLDGARRASESVGADAFALALTMFGESAVLEWSQCLQVAPAMTHQASDVAVQAAQALESAELDAAADNAVMASPLGAVLKPGAQPAATGRRPQVETDPSVTSVSLNDAAPIIDPAPTGQPIDVTGPQQVQQQ